LYCEQSGFEGFIRDKYTLLPETRERMLATAVTATWRYVPGNVVATDFFKLIVMYYYYHYFLF